jgi:transcriptional regulator with XRE-family HTH domain
MSADYFAGRLKELREQASLTQQQLAERAGMNRFGIAKLEQGVTKPWWESVLALATALGVTPNDFTCPPSTKPDTKPGRPRKSSQDSAPKPTVMKGRTAKGK